MSDSPAFTKLHDLLVWLLPLSLKFPRAHRFVLARQVQEQVFGLQHQLMRAGRTPQVRVALQEADACLAQLRATMRLAHELRLISDGQLEHFARLTTELGRLVGAWMKRA
ncbi:MAG: hypothetical protein C4K60_00190 [Ideonella sp. MAG2]|nr:MAG: hypothetical protein C4K60_00190 [Ideonella sp. MAG2]